MRARTGGTTRRCRDTPRHGLYQQRSNIFGLLLNLGQAQSSKPLGFQLLGFPLFALFFDRDFLRLFKISKGRRASVATFFVVHHVLP